jgi:hypothetical protein
MTKKNHILPPFETNTPENAFTGPRAHKSIPVLNYLCRPGEKSQITKNKSQITDLKSTGIRDFGNLAFGS